VKYSIDRMTPEQQDVYTKIIGRIPEPFRQYAWDTAWDEYHAYGYTEIFARLTDIVDVFEKIAAEYRRELYFEFQERSNQ